MTRFLPNLPNPPGPSQGGSDSGLTFPTPGFLGTFRDRLTNVALPVIQEDLGFSEANLAWVVNAYLLTFGGFMLLSGRLADLLGRRRVLMTGIALFTLASLVCGFANSQALIVVARGVQGIGGSIVNSVSLSIVLVLFPRPAERARAMSVWGFVGSVTFSIASLPALSASTKTVRVMVSVRNMTRGWT